MSKKIDIYKNVVLLTQVGLIIISSIAISLYLGNLIDNWLNTGSVFRIIFIIFGVISGFYSVYKLILGALNK